jgi:N-methylhydantoinase A/oxoprolinase/acetone carboxylase beta subunit
VGRGVDPRRLALVAFGGAGPLHACALAGALGMPAVVIPPRAGVLSAVGLLCGARQEDIVRSWPAPREHDGLDAALAGLVEQARSALGAGRPGDPAVEVVTALECRYAGQSHELRVADVADFAAEHRRRNGYDRPDTPIEVVALRATARRPAPLVVADLAPVARQPVVGPAVVAEPDCTIWVPEGWHGTPDESTGALILRRRGAGSSS